MFERAFVDASLLHCELVNILREKGIAVELVDEYKKMATPQLLILRKKTPWIIRCPCSPNSVSCGYEILDIVKNCTLGCKYCFLNTYTTNKDVILYANLDDLEKELAYIFNKKQWLRLGTGEFTDSLLLEELVPLNALLVKILSGYPCITEFKTKMNNVKSMMSIPDRYRKNVVISWTLNTEYIANNYECTSVASRVQAAKKAIDNGYFISFHFDPIVMYANYLNDYLDLIHNLAKHIDPVRVPWISMGMLRLKGDMEEGMNKGYDGKLRYYRDDRIITYKKLNQALKEAFPKSIIYLCMEDQRMWVDVLGYSSYLKEEVNERFLKIFR